MNGKQAPEFSMEKSRYDLGTYWGRTCHFFTIFNPLLLFTTNKQIEQAQKLLKKYNEGEISIKDSEMNKQLWNAKKIIDAIIHPQTQEKIWAPLRMCSFVPMNLPIAVGMITSKSPFWGLFWQWYNQSYNVMVNYANSNKSNEMPTIKIMAAYLIAVTSSCSVHYGLNKYLEKQKTKILSANPFLFKTLQITIPYAAVATAGALNVIVMRFNEIEQGIHVEDNKGNIIGRSKTAGTYAVLQCALTRVVLPLPILVFPGLIMKSLENLPIIQRKLPIKMSLNIGIVTFFLWATLPFAIGLFPQKTRIKANKLEKEFQMLGLDYYWYNKGL